ncbi:hypothetical protein F4808DRAFT_314302 [Astrocystis sublimbata]|nr:hypothetical protein F4808DRAFT_314302 [Astrocystis sublimbata]
MPSMAGTLGLNAYHGLLQLSVDGMPFAFATPLATSLKDWFALQYLLPLISFVCVGLEGWCFFDLTRKSLGARSARAIADARDAASLEDYDVIKDFPRGGFEPSNNQLCVHGLLGIKLHARHSTCPSTPGRARRDVKGLTMPCGCLIISPKGRSVQQAPRKQRREISYIAI